MSPDHDPAALDARLDAWGSAAAPPPGPLPHAIRQAARRRRNVRRARTAAVAALLLVVAAVIAPALTAVRSRPTGAPLHPVIAGHQQPHPAAPCGPTILALRACNADLDLDNLRLPRADAMAWAMTVPPLGP